MQKIAVIETVAWFPLQMLDRDTRLVYIYEHFLSFPSVRDIVWGTN